MKKKTSIICSITIILLIITASVYAFSTGQGNIFANPAGNIWYPIEQTGSDVCGGTCTYLKTTTVANYNSTTTSIATTGQHMFLQPAGAGANFAPSELLLPVGRGWISLSDAGITSTTGTWSIQVKAANTATGGTATLWIQIWNCRTQGYGNYGSDCYEVFKNYDNTTNLDGATGATIFTYTTASEPATTFGYLFAVVIVNIVAGVTDTMTFTFGSGTSFITPSGSSKLFFTNAAISCANICVVTSNIPFAINGVIIPSVKVATTLGKYMIKPNTGSSTTTCTPAQGTACTFGWQIFFPNSATLSSGTWKLNITTQDTSASGTKNVWWLVKKCPDASFTGACTFLFKIYDNTTNIASVSRIQNNYSASEPQFVLGSTNRYVMIQAFISYTVSSGSATDTITCFCFGTSQTSFLYPIS